MSSASVLQWSGLAQEAGAQYGIPPSVLLALIDEETGGRPGQTSATGAQGITQFEPSTARQYGVDTRPGHERSQVFGAAHYLADLGYQQDPERALASYNAGPGKHDLPAARQYARDVLAKAKTYKIGAAPGTGPGRVSRGSSGPGYLRIFLSVVLVAAGLSAVVVGGGRMIGVDVPRRAAQAAGSATKKAAVAAAA